MSVTPELMLGLLLFTFTFQWCCMHYIMTVCGYGYRATVSTIFALLISMMLYSTLMQHIV